jgi:tripeptide aminopeptidase
MDEPYGSALAGALRNEALERFLRYVRLDTQADRDSSSTPSSAGQLLLGRLLADELAELGLAEIVHDGRGVVTARLPPSAGIDGPHVGLLAHLDTSPDAPGSDVRPQLWRGYDGGAIVLPGDPTQVLSPATSALLSKRIGHDLVSSDGTTLLGADDKAGIAEIMTAVAYLCRHPEVPRPDTRIGFTVDEEIGRGAEQFPLERFGADFAYTLDGLVVGEVENETFSAVELKVTFRGVGVHPGTAKDKLVNPLRLAARFLCSLPAELSPEHTEGREGFVHPTGFSGGAEEAAVALILRDFDQDKLAAHEELVRRLANAAIADEPRASVSFARWEQYRNMRSRLEAVPRVVEAALEAARRVGLEPTLGSIRGGTDGARLTEMGLPTPNVYTGGNEYHSVREWISVEDLAISAATVVELLKLWAEGAALS